MATYNAHMVAARLHKLVQHISEMSYGAILAFYSSSILLFAFIYFLMGTFTGVAIVSSFGSIEPTSFWDFLYFSVITATSTGYGDCEEQGEETGISDFRKWAKPQVALIVSGQMHGYIDPCGCSSPQNGGLTRKNGDWFRQQLLSRGGSVDALQLFRNFRGRDASIDALLVRRGLVGK